ncbi:MAG: FecR domain-containing protein [Myxococcaceae bacterium]
MSRLRAQLALAVLLLAAPAAAAVGQVAALEGKAVRIPKAGAEQALSVGAALELEDTVRTESKASVKLLLSDGTALALGPDSELVFDVAEFSGQERGAFSARLVLGQFWAKVKKVAAGSTSRFEVKAGRAVAGVRGTIFRVDATPLVAGSRPPKIRETLVRVLEGKVGVDAEIRKAKGAPTPPPGPRHEVPGPSEVTAEEWEKRFVELQARQQVSIGDTYFRTGTFDPNRKDALDRFLDKHP